MRTLLANAAGPVRRVQVHGRQFLVAPVTMIVPGVLAGSNGPLYYPPDEVARDPQRWNGVPITLGHPRSTDGHPVSGRSPEVLNSVQLGTVYRARYDGKALRAEAWFDEELVKRNGPDVHVNLLSGRVTELSTGLFTDDEPVSNGKDPVSGKPYTHVARNYRPDHLAVLVGVKGACSVADGCGVLVNAKYLFKSVNCPSCDAVMAGDPDTGKCNRCGKKYGTEVTADAKASEDALTPNVFCPTGEGGGVDPSCGSGEGGGGGEGRKARDDAVDALLNDPEVLKDFRPPEFMYHVTSRANADKILKQGLKPGQTRASSLGTSRGVYLTDSPGDVSKQGGDIGTSDSVTLKISTKGLDLRLDPEYFYYDDVSTKGAKSYVESINAREDQFAVYSTKKIPKSAISLVKKPTRNLLHKFLDFAAMVANVFQPHSSDTGRFKAPNAGTGKADTRDHALIGATELTDSDVTLGTAAAVHAATTGTPGARPPWATDAARWEKATAAALKSGEPATSSRYYALAVHVYRSLGGEVTTTEPPPPSTNADAENARKGKGRKARRPSAGLAMSPAKACKILHDGTVHGKPLTERQRGMFGAKCSGGAAGSGKGKSKKAKRNQSSVTVNQSSEDTEMATKAENVKTLTTNCECWKGREKVLDAMDDKLLDDLVKQNEDAEELNLVVNELREEFGAGEDTVALNAMPAFIKKKKIKAKDADPDDDDDDDDDMTDDDWAEVKRAAKRGKRNQSLNQQEDTTVNKESVLAVLNSLSQDELLALPGMAGIRERDQLSQQILTNQKSQLVDRLTETITDPARKKARKEKLGKLSLNELMDRVEDLPPPARSAASSAAPHSTPAPTFYLGAGPTGNAGRDDDDYKPKPMQMPTINWAEEKKLLDAGVSNRAS